MHIQAPPNLSYDDFPRLLDAGIDDWGGVSPVTIDHVNPEAPWPEIERLRAATEAAGSSWRRACRSTRSTSPTSSRWCDAARRDGRAAPIRRERPGPRGPWHAGAAEPTAAGPLSRGPSAGGSRPYCKRYRGSPYV